MIHPELKEAMLAIESTVAHVLKNHEANQRFWVPTELIPEGHTFPELSPELTGMLILNLLTEDGLPYFTMNLDKHLGSKGPFRDWNCLWTAEEDRHGSVIKLYLQQSLSREALIYVERLQYDYLRVGFWPQWSNDPFQLLAYVVIQEQATQLSHAGIARGAAHVDPVLMKIMSKIAGEENKHHLAYLKMFTALMEINPSHALYSLQQVIKNFVMPGTGIPDFELLAYLQQRQSAFGPKEFADILTRLWDTLAIANLSQLTEVGERARDKIHNRIKALRLAAEKTAKGAAREIFIPFLNRTVTV